MTAEPASELMAHSARRSVASPMVVPTVGDGDIFREAFRRYASTVVVLSYLDQHGEPCGMTATSVCSLSASPPSLLACINREARTLAEITRRGRFGVNMLSIEQRPIARHCSRAGVEKRLLNSWLSDAEPGSTPRLNRALAHLECRLEDSYELFSHSVLVGVIGSVWLNPDDAPPLLYHGGQYHQLESPVGRAERFHWQDG